MENLKEYRLEMSDVCREAFETYYGSGIKLYEDENEEIWYQYPNSDKIYCIGNMGALEEMLMSIGNYDMDIRL